jgi:hypothetical protein
VSRLRFTTYLEDELVSEPGRISVDCASDGGDLCVRLDGSFVGDQSDLASELVDRGWTSEVASAVADRVRLDALELASLGGCP